MSVLTIAANAIRRLVRDRSSLFFVFVFPLLLVLMLGASFGGPTTYELIVVAAEDGPVVRDLLTALEATDRVEVVRSADEDRARDRVARGRADGAVVVRPDGPDGTSNVEYLVGTTSTAPMLQVPVQAAIAELNAIDGAARAAAAVTGVDIARAQTTAVAVRDATTPVRAQLTIVGDDGDRVLAEYEDTGAFTLVAHQELLLFTFLTSLAAASALIQSRQLGVSRRMLAAPTTVGRILLGEALGRFGVAMVQALYLVVGTALLFGVSWGRVDGWLPLIALFSLVSSAAGMLMGAAFRNDSQASSLGVFFGLALAAIGGCMLPLELFSPTMKQVAHLTPHAWALDGFRVLTGGGGGALAILPELAALTGFAVVLLVAGTVALRRALLRSV